MSDRLVIPAGERGEGSAERQDGDVCFPRSTALAVARSEARDRSLGILAGLIAIVLGALMIFAGIGSEETQFVFKLGQAELSMTTAVPGLVFAAIGLSVIFVTQPKVVQE